MTSINSQNRAIFETLPPKTSRSDSDLKFHGLRTRM